MSERWRHDRKTLADVPETDKGGQRGVVEEWWYGEHDYVDSDRHVVVKAMKGPEDSSWMYMVEDGLNYVDPEQHWTRADAVEDARNRVGLYREKLARGVIG